MGAPLTQLFLYKMIFLAELLVAEAIFARRLRPRRHFLPRAVAALLCCFAFAYWFPLARYTVLYNSVMFFSIFAVTLAALAFCFEENGWNLLFCALVGYTVQHIAFVVNDTAVVLFRLDTLLSRMGSMTDPYSNTQRTGAWNPLEIICYLDCYVLVYWYLGYFLSRRMKRGEDLSLGRKPLIVLAGVLVAVDIWFNMITVMNPDATRQTVLLENAYNLLCCALALVLQFGTLTRHKLAQNNEILQQMLEQKEKQYKIRRESMELVDIKYHDLKHQLGLLRNQMSEQALQGMEEAVDRYRAAVRTGNEHLDIILMEKAMLCQKHGMDFSVIADGAALDFLDPTDLYSLFGNALENAMEYLETVPQREKRFVHVSVRRTGQLAVIRVENYYDGPDLTPGGALPATSKQDKAFHGFGMRSIQLTAEKYGGQFSVQAQGHLFALNVLLPRPQPSAN